MIFKHNCDKRGHKYEARYDEVPNEKLLIPGMNMVGNAEKIKELMILKIYIKDICIYCGKEIKR